MSYNDYEFRIPYATVTTYEADGLHILDMFSKWYSFFCDDKFTLIRELLFISMATANTLRRICSCHMPACLKAIISPSLKAMIEHLFMIVSVLWTTNTLI